MLAAFSDRLGVRFGEATLACRVVDGRRGRLDDESVVRDAPAFVATEVTEVEAARLGRTRALGREIQEPEAGRVVA